MALNQQPNLATDVYQRPLRCLRVSVTDRCNFRCVYCMPREVFGPGYAFVPREDLLTLEEIARIARVFTAIGMRKVRITGGEPLIRRNLEHLIEMIDAMDEVDEDASGYTAALFGMAKCTAQLGKHKKAKRLLGELEDLDPGFRSGEVAALKRALSLLAGR